MEAVKSNMAALMNLSQPSARTKTKDSDSAGKFREFLSETRQDTRKETNSSKEEQDVADEPVINEAAALLFAPRIMEYLNTVQVSGDVQEILPVDGTGRTEEVLSLELTDLGVEAMPDGVQTPLLSEAVQEGARIQTDMNSIPAENMKPLAELPDEKTDMKTETAKTADTSLEKAISQAAESSQADVKTVDSETLADNGNTGVLETMLSRINRNSEEQKKDSEGKTEEVTLNQLTQKEFHDVSEPAAEVVTVKAEQPEDLSQKLMDQIMKKAALRQKEFEVQLEPHNLGKISIKISYSENQTTVSVLCTEAKTLSLLSEHAKEMGAILETNLGTPTNIFVEKQDSNYLDQQKSDDGQKGWSGQEQNHSGRNRDGESNPSDFIQKLRLGIVSGFEMEL